MNSDIRRTDPADGRIRLTILSGFLGSGKTTWLRHQLHANRYMRAFVIVNEASQTPVDDALLAHSRHLAVVAGGCACCDARAQLVTELRRICDLRSRIDSRRERIDHIVIEASGLADPGRIVEAIASDPVLVHHVLMAEIIVMIDAVNAMRQLRTEALSRRQSELADRIIVTKTEETTEVALGRLLATLRHLNPCALISGANRGIEIDLPTSPHGTPEEFSPSEPDSCRAPLFASNIVLGRAIDWTALGLWLAALLHVRGDDVARAKGIIRTPAGRILLQAVGRIVQPPEILPASNLARSDHDDRIVVIGRGYREEDLVKSLRYFAGAEPRRMTA